MTETAARTSRVDSDAELGQELARALDKITNLEVALASSRRIGIAIGILMASHKVTDDQAFDLLRKASEMRHIKVRDLADLIAFTGSLD